MARSALLLAILVLVHGSHFSYSFSVVPGAMRGTASPTCRQSADSKCNLPAFGLSIGGREDVAAAATTGCWRDAGGSGTCLRATTASAVEESSGYLEEKEALKEVRVCFHFDCKKNYCTVVRTFELLRVVMFSSFADVPYDKHDLS